MSENIFELRLYGTLGCHLCDVAAELCQAVANHLQSYDITLTIVSVDIADDPDLLEKYGYTIPVLENPLDGRQINWPFGGDDVLQLLETVHEE